MTSASAKARELAAQYREMLAVDIDPIAYRDAKRAESAAAIPVPDFDTLANSYLAAHRPGWRNPLHAKHWESSLQTYVSPVIGKLPVERDQHRPCDEGAAAALDGKVQHHATGARRIERILNSPRCANSETATILQPGAAGFPNC